MYPLLVKSEEILACRACLVTNEKVFKIRDQLGQIFGQLTGTQVFHTDGLPQYLCLYCRAMLLKFDRFRNKVQASQNILLNTLVEHQYITTECLSNLSTDFHNVCFLWSIQKQISIELLPGKDDTDEVKFEFVSTKNATQNLIPIEVPNILPEECAAKLQTEENDLLKAECHTHELNSKDIKDEFDQSEHSYDDVQDLDDEVPEKKIKKTRSKITELVYKANTRKVKKKSTFKYTNNEATCSRTSEECEMKRKKEDKKKRESNEAKRSSDTSFENCENKRRTLKKSNFETDEYWFWFEDEEKKTKFEQEFNFEVMVLTKDQQIEAMQAKKNDRNYIDSPYKCDLCFRGYLNIVGFKNHMASHELKQDGDVVCDVCGQHFRHKKQLGTHTVIHKVKLKCKECGYTNSKKSRAMEHFRAHQGHKFECEHCGNTFRLKSNYYTHLRFLHPSELLSCEICGEGFCGEKGLVMHKRMHLLDEVVKNKRNSELRCAECGTVFRNAAAWDAHSSLGRDRFCDLLTKTCTECGENFADDESLNKHSEKHQQQYQCDACEMTFSSEASRTTHYERKHLSVKRKDMRHANKYQYYYKKYKERDGVRQRGRQARGSSGQEGTSMCEYCGKKFRCPAALSAHHRTHTGDRPFQCNICHKSFTSRNYLQMHYYAHTGERPYQCKLCPKAFSKKSVLNVHQRVHTGAKPYTCPACGKSFTQSNSLKLHITTVHLKQPAPYKSKKRLQRQQERQAKSEA